MTIGSLFSGIGGLELGLEWAGLGPTLWQVEQESFCNAVLAKHWPEAQRFHDVRTVGKSNLVPVDLICGGFPCQDVSSAGKGAGLAGKRSGLWREFARVVAELQPQWVVVENVTSGARKWFDAVVRQLEQLGYDVLPLSLSASDCGAPHRRARIFLVAHRHGARELQPQGDVAEQRGRVDNRFAADADSDSIRLESWRGESERAGKAFAPDAVGFEGRPGFAPIIGWSPQSELVRSIHGFSSWTHGGNGGVIEERGQETCSASSKDHIMRAMREDDGQAGASPSRLPETDRCQSAVHKVSRSGRTGIGAAPCPACEAVPSLWREFQGLHTLDSQNLQQGVPGSSRGDECKEEMGPTSVTRNGEPDSCPICGRPVGARDCGKPLIVAQPGTPRFERIARRARIRALGNSVVPQCAETVGWVIRELAGEERRGAA